MWKSKNHPMNVHLIFSISKSFLIYSKEFYIKKNVEHFFREYFSQFRPYFKNHPIAVQFVEHLWKNMMESSKVAFVRKVLKEQGNYDHSTTDYNDGKQNKLNIF